MSVIRNASRHSQRSIFIATYPPQKCGIATFTHDLGNAVAGLSGRERVHIAAVSENPKAQSYPDEVAITFDRNDRRGFRAVADYINLSNYDVVCVQHEFGIFGGDEGGYLLDLLDALRKPVVTTLHTVLAHPSQPYHTRLREVVEASDAVVVLTPTATRLLSDIYHVPTKKVRVIPHGIPDSSYVDSEPYKAALGMQGRMVLMTFGLIGPSKGIEEMIEALPAIVQRHPEVLYMIVGATHPSVVSHQGESYRQSLERKVAELGLSDNVVFHNRYLSDAELCEYLNACDIYVTPYPNREQISSGTLAYATGMGKAVVSTSYWYAQDLLANGRGKLIDFRSAKALSDAINGLIENHEERETMRRKAYEYGRRMCWPQIAESYLKLFEDIRGGRQAEQYLKRVGVHGRSTLMASSQGRRLVQPEPVKAYYQSAPPNK